MCINVKIWRSPEKILFLETSNGLLQTLGNLTFIFIYQLVNSKRIFFISLGRNKKVNLIDVVR